MRNRLQERRSYAVGIHFKPEVLSMFCESCGKQVNESSAFCANCGEPADAKASAGAAHQAVQASAAKADITGDLANELKARSKDVWEGLKTLAVNPLSGLSSSFQSFGDQRALRAAVGFTILYLFSISIAVYRGSQALLGLAAFGAPLNNNPGFPFLFPTAPASAALPGMTFGQILRVLLCGLITVFTLAVAAMLARLAFRGKGTFLGDYYIASASLLPIAIAVFLVSLVGLANIEIMFFLVIFAFVYNILMLYAGCSRISGVPESGAVPAVPIMLLLTLYVAKVAVAAILF
jgi:hypothetical protein